MKIGPHIYRVKRWMRHHNLSDDWLPWTVACVMIALIVFAKVT